MKLTATPAFNSVACECDMSTIVIAALPASGLQELDMPQEERLRLAPTHFREQDGGSRSWKS